MEFQPTRNKVFCLCLGKEKIQLLFSTFVSFVLNDQRFSALLGTKIAFSIMSIH